MPSPLEIIKIEELKESIEKARMKILPPAIEVSSFMAPKIPDLNEVSKNLNSDVKKDLKKNILDEEMKNEATNETNFNPKKFKSKTKRGSKKSKQVSWKDKPERKNSGLSCSSKKKDKPCIDCGLYFSAQGLGGHRAKAHKGENHEYKGKMMVRK